MLRLKGAACCVVFTESDQIKLPWRLADWQWGLAGQRETSGLHPDLCDVTHLGARLPDRPVSKVQVTGHKQVWQAKHDHILAIYNTNRSWRPDQRTGYLKPTCIAGITEAQIISRDSTFFFSTQVDLCLTYTLTNSGFPLESTFYISIRALIKKLLYSQSLRELAANAQALLLFSASGRNGAFGNQMSSLLPGSSLSSNLLSLQEWLSPSGKHLMLSSALASLLICLKKVSVLCCFILCKYLVSWYIF